MEVYMELKKYSDFQRDYCKMLKNIKDNDMVLNDVKDNIIEMSHLMNRLSSVIEDININLTFENKKQLITDHEREILNEYNKNKKIIKKMMPYLILLKYNCLINK